MKALLTSVLACAAVGVAGCGTDPEPAPSQSPPASSQPAVTAGTSTTPSAASTLPAGVDQLVQIKVRDGHVTGVPGRVKVKSESTVQLRVDSDVADEVHVHGYDKSVDVSPGHPARLTFKASIPGLFEVELESRKQRLTQLQVQ